MNKINSPAAWTRHLLPMHPIVYITTVSNKGIDNGAVYATCLDTSYNPSQVTFASAVKQHNVVDSLKKNELESKVQDTLMNIKENGLFIVNVPGFDIADAMRELAYPHTPEVDEISRAQLTKLKPLILKKHDNYPKIIGECLAHIECELASNGIHQVGGSDHILVTGNVVGTSYDSRLGIDLDEIRKNLVNNVFGQLGASPKLDCRYVGKINLHELENTLVFEAERK